MVSFKNRSTEKELLDGDDIPFADIRQNMKELDVINSRLGGHRVTLRGMRAFIEKLKSKKEISILEIGSGGGDNLRAIRNAFDKIYSLRLTGVDINLECISFAQSVKENNGIDFVCSDYMAYTPATKSDVIFSSLFCHHFTDHELIEMVKWMKDNSGSGFFINDLHRHPVAYYSISFLTKLFSKSRLVKNDAPVSVKRGFKKKDWIKIFHAVGIENYSIKWCWAFRWLIIYHH
jgi:2-polyprenyl-3-methyl-5-hydroxy-6-metoxy-1,4-benzoquinol methylase